MSYDTRVDPSFIDFMQVAHLLQYLQRPVYKLNALSV